MMLTIRLGTKSDLAWAQEIVTAYHYLHQPVHNQARPMVYVIEYLGEKLGLIMVGNPHATRCRGWWGYPGLINQWQVVDLCRILFNPRIQFGGGFALSPGIVPGFRDRKGIFRPTVASWAIQEVLKRVQKDRISLWPPVLIDDPYHIRLVISYHDPKYHRGNIYKVSDALPMYTDENDKPIPSSSSGKYGWCWKLPEPTWTWQDINIKRSRQLRMAL